MTIEREARVKLIVERAAARAISPESAVDQVRKELDDVGLPEIVAAHVGASAEQLAIAMMAEARKLYGFTRTPDAPGWTDVADRLAQWATEVRQLGVQHFSVMADMTAAVASRTRAEVKLARVRELCEKSWRTQPRGQFVNAVLEVLDD